MVFKGVGVVLDDFWPIEYPFQPNYFFVCPLKTPYKKWMKFRTENIINTHIYKGETDFFLFQIACFFLCFYFKPDAKLKV